MKARWVPHDLRDEVVDFLNLWSSKTGIALLSLLSWLGLGTSKFYDWRKRYGKANEHNSHIPRDHWLMDWEKKAIVDFKQAHPLNGTRRLAFMMNDAGVVFVSPRTVHRVLSTAGLIDSKSSRTSSKGKGFSQPERAHKHWHVDVSYINICGTFYYLCSVLDGYSRSILHWDIREQMKEPDVEMIIQKALDRFPGEKPRIITDNGPQFISREFKEFVRLCGMDHVRTSPYYPQSNGKIERWHGTLKEECIRVKPVESLEDAKRRTKEFVGHYNNERLHASIGYVTPNDKLAGRADEIQKRRDEILALAREKRALMRRGIIPLPEGGYGNAGERPEQPTGHGKQSKASGTGPPAFRAGSAKPQGVWGTESPGTKIV